MNKEHKWIDWESSKLFNLLMEVMVLIVVFIMPTIFDRRLGIVFSGTKTTWMRVFGILILSIWVIRLIVTKKHRFIKTPLDWPVLSFLLCTTVATLTSVHVYTSFVGFYGRYEGLTSWYLFGLFFFLVTNYIRSSEQVKRIFITSISAATLMAVYSFIQRFGWDPYMWGGVTTWHRVIGMIGQPNFLAAYMLMALFLNLSMFMLKKKELDWSKVDWAEQLITVGYFLVAQVTFVFMIYNLDANNVILWYLSFIIITASAVLFAFNFNKLHPWILNTLLGITLVLNYVCILFTQSRGGYMGLFTGASLFALVVGRHWIISNWKKIAILGFIILLISGITMSNPKYSPFARFAGEVTTEKVEDGAKDQKKSNLELKGAAGSRGETWKSAFVIIADYPFFGIGPEVLKMIFPRYETDLFRFKEAFHVKQDRCHNEIFDVAVTKGLITFFVFLWILFVFFRVGWKKSRIAKDSSEKLLLGGLLAASLAFLIQNQFSFGVVAITSLFWMIWAMVMVLGKEEKEEEEEKIAWLEIPWLYIGLVILISIVAVYISFFSFRGDVSFKSGKVNMQMRRLPQAEKEFINSLNVFPFEGGTVSHLGITYLNLGNTIPAERKKYFEKSIETLKYGNRVDPYNADNFYILSKIYYILFRTGDKKALKQAQENALIAIKVDPYYAEVYNMLGLIYEAQGRNNEAAVNYERTFLINPNLTQAMVSLERVNDKRGKRGETLKSFEKAVARYPNYPVIAEKLAQLYLQKGQIREAIDLANTMLKDNPKSVQGLSIRAESYYKQRDIKNALSDYQQVLISDPKNINAHLKLGEIYFSKGNRAMARNEFEQVVLLDMNNSYAKKMLIKLR
jgi:tetratricopeptide (TPR) repeat protein